MDSQNGEMEIQAVAAEAEVRETEKGFDEKLGDVAGLLAESYPRRTRVLTEKGLAYWIETRDKRQKNQDRYRYIIDGHIVRIYDILKTSEGIDMIDELLVKVTQAYKDYTRQFTSEEEQMSDPLFLQTFNKVKDVQQDIQSWKANANAASISRAKPNSIKSGSSKFSRKLKLSKSSHSSCKTMDDVIKNRTKLATLQAKAQYFEKEKQVELELDRTRLEKEIAIAKATEKIHQEFLNDDYELNSLEDKNIQCSKVNDNAMADSCERKPTLSHFHDEYANAKIESVLPANDQRSYKAPMFSTQARCNLEKTNLQPEILQFHPTVAHGVATTSFPGPTLPPIPNPSPTPMPHPTPFSNQSNEMLYHLLEKQGEYLRQQGLPHVTPDIYTGDSLKYKMFMTLFDMTVDSKISSPKEKLAILIEYTGGEPKNLIETCLYQPPETGYRRARELLEKHYGNPIQVANAHMEKLISWPKIYDNDSKKLREFYVYLVKCQGCLTDEEYVHELNTSSLLQALCLKLQERLQRQWATQVYTIKSTKSRRANFRDFVEFIGKESEVASDPTFSKEAMSKIITKRPSYSPRTQRDAARSKITSFVTKSEETDTAINTKLNATNQANNSVIDAKNTVQKCPFCKEKHCLDSCQTFMNRSPFARKMFVISHKLCFGCYSPSHTVTNCTQKLVCREKDCGMSHPTGMHGTHRIKGKAKTSTNDVSQINNGCTKCDDANDVSAEVLSLSVLPMLLWHKSNPNHVIKVYGMLDNCSQGTFIKKDILANLNAPKVDTKISIKTITGIVKEDAHIVKDLIVSNLDGSNQIGLPKVFSRQDLPIDRNEIPTPERVRSWSYLEEIADEIPDLDCDIPIGLLIGVNCPAALRPTEVIKEKNGGPFAQRTAFGWCVVGPLLNRQSADNSIKCNRIAVADVTTNKCSQHYFAVQDEVKDVNAATVLIDMYRKDFNEPTPKEMKNQLLKGVCPPESTNEKLLTKLTLQQNEQSISREDEKFLVKIERETILVNGHYQLPLPFREDNVKMPNNREQAEQRSRWIKKKFANKQFKEDYVTFMNDIISKGYARKVPESNIKVEEGKTWYLPHHGVYHPNKPSKIRVVFDCSCDYKGTSLNEELLQGPNLTNSLVGVLTRFRLEPVAVMADIEAMFYQVNVPENQRSFLRFLWWPNGNTDECLAEYEMCVHIFGAISSPACANFALHKTAEENKEKFGYEAFKCVKEDFYVDDFLTSKGSVESVVDLISKIKMMCASGGFKLTKFVSNERAVIQSIPDEDRSKNIKKPEFGTRFATG